MKMDADLEISERGGIRVLVASGELSLAAAAELEQRLHEALTPEVRMVVLDVEQVDFIDSTGLSVLVRAHQRAQESGIEFGIVKPASQFERLLRLTGLEDRLTLSEAEQQVDGAEH